MFYKMGVIFKALFEQIIWKNGGKARMFPA
jgi:hypothetical protein